jgi:lipoprotein-releasing system permease protein
MFLPASFFIGLRYSRSQRHKGFVSFITFFSIAGIVLGVASLILVVSVMNGFEGELKKRILGLVPHVIVAPQIAKKSPSNSPKAFDDWQNIRQSLLNTPHVSYVTPLLQSEALIQSSKALQGVLIVGILPEYEKHNIVNSHMVAGTLDSLDQTPYSLVLGKSLAYKLDVSLGDTVRLVLPNKTLYTPMGRIPVQRNFTVTGIFNVGSEVDGTVIYTHSKYGAKLLRQKGDGINQLRLYLDDAFNAEMVGELVKTQGSFDITTWSNSQGALFSAVKMEKNMMWLMLSLIIAVAAFNIVSALVMVVIDKQGEIGILQTLGMNRRNILNIFVVQGVSNGLWGVFIGATLGVLVTLNLNEILSFLSLSVFGAAFAGQNLPVDLKVTNVVIIVLSALLTSFLATLYPAYRASKTLPAEVLRNE